MCDDEVRRALIRLRGSLENQFEFLRYRDEDDWDVGYELKDLIRTIRDALKELGDAR